MSDTKRPSDRMRMGFYLAGRPPDVAVSAVVGTFLALGSEAELDVELSAATDSKWFRWPDDSYVEIGARTSQCYPTEVQVILSGATVARLGPTASNDLHVRVAVAMAADLRQAVVTDLPRRHPRAQVPFLWLEASPSGRLLERCESTETEQQTDDLVFDPDQDRELRVDV